MFRLSKSLFSIFIFALSFVTLAHAQGLPGVGNPLSITMFPAEPRPNDVVTMTVDSLSFDVNSSHITWSADGKVILKGTGEKSVKVQAGNLGVSKKVTVTVSTLKSGNFTDSKTIRPADVSLIWQAYTSVPPFYKGKALQTYGGVYKVVAIPDVTDQNGKRIESKNLIYNWKKNGDLDKVNSGYGKSSYVSMQSGFLQANEEISVEVVTSDNFTVTGHAIVPPVSPQVLIYEKNPLYGVIFEKAHMNNIDLRNEELTLAAEPYFFTAPKNNSSLSFSWLLDGGSVPNYTDKNSITFRKTPGESGAASVGVEVTNKTNMLQVANQELRIRYE